MTEPLRPREHFSPAMHWMNDPNGLIFHSDCYHLFYQHHPHSNLWGPMHWGHAKSTDLLNWEHLPIALEPDALGMIFSGSVVLDERNSAGFGKDDGQAMIAMFTHHDPLIEAAGSDEIESQSLAFSLDGGLTWEKYALNPVLSNPGLRHFRDPKVMWWAAGNAWIATIACGDHVRFYSSKNLRDWRLAGRFDYAPSPDTGSDCEAVWECPDLLCLSSDEGIEKWLLLLSVTQGAPAGGSGTQYFLGSFDGATFHPDDLQTRWLDHGPDNYAGVTFFGVNDRALFMGWMSNWRYASATPTHPWRGAMTLPRELQLRRASDGWRVASVPAREWAQKSSEPVLYALPELSLGQEAFALKLALPKSFRLQWQMECLKSFECCLSNEPGEALSLGYDALSRRWWLNRERAGESGFHADFAKRYVCERFTQEASSQIVIGVDACSVELFADGGLSVMTALCFARAPWSRIEWRSAEAAQMQALRIAN